VVSICVVAVLGVPAFLVLHKFQLVSWYSSVIAGLLIGVLVAIAITLPNVITPRDALIMGTVGGLSAFCFWEIWKHGRDSAEGRAQTGI
jgi:hypothetical protein